MSQIIFFSMGGQITTQSFWALYRSKMKISAVIKPFPPQEIPQTEVRWYSGKWWPKKRKDEPLLTTTSMREIIPSLGIDLVESTRADHPALVEWLRKRKPTLFLIATYNHIFKKTLLQLPQKGTINFHPSLLPHYRGPNPLFWMYKNFDDEAGISIHFVDPGIDTGDIIYQAKIPLTEGMRGCDLNKQLALLGAPFLVKAAQDVLNGSVQSFPQKLEEGSYYSHPTKEDLRIEPQKHSARYLYHFVHGTARWMNLFYQNEEHHFDIIDAIKYELNRSLPGEFFFSKDLLLLNCQDGILTLQAKIKQRFL